MTVNGTSVTGNIIPITEGVFEYNIEAVMG